MRKEPIFFLLFFISFLSITNAQNESQPNALSWRWTWNNFQFPITENLDNTDFTTGAEIAYYRYLNRWLNLSIPLKIGKAGLPVDDLGTVIDEELIGSLDAVLHLNFLKDDARVQPYLLAGAGMMLELENDTKTNVEIPLGLGLNVRLSKGFYATADTQYRLGMSDNRNQLMYRIGVKFNLGKGEPDEVKISDRDMDGIMDDEDQCPTEPGTKALMGCPDTDKDGITDKLDDCPTTAGLASLNGCPDADEDNVPDHLDECPTVPGLINNKGCPNDDRDGDGISNSEDDCPDTPGTEYTKGCPDLDSDGIADKDDKCPSQSGLPENMGCPDTDGDGVADPFDKCPGTVGPASNAGCPELKPEEKEVLDFAMQAVQFETGSTKLLSSSNEVLNQIAEILVKYPGRKLRIGGHTDSIGSATANMELSQKRAKVCYDYLVERGVSKSRMEYMGFGETVPIADNRFAPGREKNRRVTFEIYVE